MCSGPTDASSAAFCQCLLISLLQLSHQLNEEISNSEAFESQTPVWLAVLANFRGTSFLLPCSILLWFPLGCWEGVQKAWCCLWKSLWRLPLRETFSQEMTHGDIRDRFLRSTSSNYFYHMPDRQP